MKKFKTLVITIISVILLAALIGVGTYVMADTIEGFNSENRDDTYKPKAILDKNNRLTYKKFNLSYYKNVYCVAHWADLDEEMTFDSTIIMKATSMVDIKGDVATFYVYNYDSNGNLIYDSNGNPTYTKTGTTTSTLNNVLAGIVSNQNSGESFYDLISDDVSEEKRPTDLSIVNFYKGYGSVKLNDYNGDGEYSHEKITIDGTDKYEEAIGYTISQVALWQQWNEWVEVQGTNEGQNSEDRELGK